MLAIARFNACNCLAYIGNFIFFILLPPCHQMASNALFKGKIGGSRVAAKWLILAFSASQGTQNHTLFRVS